MMIFIHQCNFAYRNRASKGLRFNQACDTSC
jgi:hypothetical protein